MRKRGALEAVRDSNYGHTAPLLAATIAIELSRSALRCMQSVGMSASYLHDDSSPATPWVVPILEELTVTPHASRIVASLQLDEPGSTGALRRSRASAKLCAAWVWEFVDKLAKNIQASSSACFDY